jgi:hypothetical protein
MSDELDRPCRRCGRRDWMRPSTRFDRETCSDACRKGISRGEDLAYLKDWSDDQARIRRFLHDAISDGIAVEKMLRAQRREYRTKARKQARLRPPIVRVSPTNPAVAPSYAPDSFFVLKE